MTGEAVEALLEDHEPEIDGYCDSGDIRMGCSCGWNYWASVDYIGSTWTEHFRSVLAAVPHTLTVTEDTP